MSDADSARHDSASAAGWMLLHGPTAYPAHFTDLLDRLGLQPDGGKRMRMGGVDIEWREGADARAVAGALAGGDGDLLGVAAAPSLMTGQTLAFRVADTQRAAAVQPLLRLCTAVGMVAAAVGAECVGWLPANLWSSTGLFGDAVVATERQGLPPVMHLVAFDTAGGAVATRGLAWFCGHELRLTAPSGYPAREALRRAARLAVDALMHDGLAGPMTVTGIDKGEELAIGARVDAGGTADVPVELRPPPG